MPWSARFACPLPFHLQFHNLVYSLPLSNQSMQITNLPAVQGMQTWSPTELRDVPFWVDLAVVQQSFHIHSNVVAPQQEPHPHSNSQYGTLAPHFLCVALKLVCKGVWHGADCLRHLARQLEAIRALVAPC